MCLNKTIWKTHFQLKMLADSSTMSHKVQVNIMMPLDTSLMIFLKWFAIVLDLFNIIRTPPGDPSAWSDPSLCPDGWLLCPPWWSSLEPQPSSDSLCCFTGFTDGSPSFPSMPQTAEGCGQRSDCDTPAANIYWQPTVAPQVAFRHLLSSPRSWQDFFQWQ